MTDAVEEVVAEDVVLDSAAEAAADAEFDAGFDGTPTEVDKTPPADAVADPVVEPVPEVKYRQITEAEWNVLQAKSTEIDQIKADHRRELDRAFGKVGGVERTLAALQAATPAGYAVEVTDDVVAELNAEFPELGGLVLKTLKGFAGKLKGTAPTAAAIDPEQIEATVTARLRNLQAEALDDEHADWRDVVGAPDSNNEYRQWLAKQSAEYQQRLGSTNSAAIISRSITKFKGDTASATAAAAEAAAKAAAKAAAEKAAAEKVAARTNRLEAAAAAPRGTGGHAPADTEDDFEAGFKSG